MEELVKTLEVHLPRRYKILEGDHDTVYVMDRVTEEHFEIKVSKCSE